MVNQVLVSFGPGSPDKSGKENTPVKVSLMLLLHAQTCVYVCT